MGHSLAPFDIPKSYVKDQKDYNHWERGGLQSIANIVGLGRVDYFLCYRGGKNLNNLNSLHKSVVGQVSS